MNLKESTQEGLWACVSSSTLHSFLSFFFFKSLLNLLQYCFCFMFWFFWPRGMWDLSSPNRDWTRTPCIGRWSLNHWTAREVPLHSFLNLLLSSYSFCLSLQVITISIGSPPPAVSNEGSDIPMTLGPFLPQPAPWEESMPHPPDP